MHVSRVWRVVEGLMSHVLAFVWRTWIKPGSRVESWLVMTDADTLVSFMTVIFSLFNHLKHAAFFFVFSFLFLGGVARCCHQPFTVALTLTRLGSLKFLCSFEDNSEVWHPPTLLCLAPLLGSAVNPHEPAGIYKTNRRAHFSPLKGKWRRAAVTSTMRLAKTLQSFIWAH